MPTTAQHHRVAPAQSTAAPQALHVGRRDHYRLAADLVDRQPDRVILMQRSSSLLLGAEAGWDEEAMFVASAARHIARGGRWFHIASSVGIYRHLRRPGSAFPDRATAAARLVDLDGNVGLGTAVGSAIVVKDLPPDGALPDLKIDRQARLLVADFDGRYESVVVIDVGDRQCSLHQFDSDAGELFDVCLEFWEQCPPLRWTEFERVAAVRQPVIR